VMHLGPRKKPRDRQAGGTAKLPSSEIAALAGSALEDPAFSFGDLLLCGAARG
jgi:hypothetical protein